MREVAGVERWGAQMDEIERAARDEPAFVIAVARALDGAGEAPAFRSLRDHAWRSLAIVPGIEQALAAIDLAKGTTRSPWDRVGPPRVLRALAAMLTQSQPHEVVFEIADRFETSAAHAELLALLLHEAVLRGAAVETQPAFVRFARDLRGRGHPLSLLPLHRLAIEEELPRRRWGARSSGGGWSSVTPPASADGDSREHLARRRRGWRVNEITANAESVEIRACAVTMLEESNGTAEARVFEVSPSVPDDVPALLWSLELECLQEMTGDLRVVRGTAKDAFRLLFGIAEVGGAYDHGLDGAWGRLHAWRSLAALAEAPPGSPLETTAAKAEKECTWHFFFAVAPFFMEVAWDAALACVRADATVATFAVSDTD